MKTVELTEEEIQVTIQLIDIAVKASGLNAAEAASILAKKFGSHLQEPPSEVENAPVFAEEAPELEVLDKDD